MSNPINRKTIYLDDALEAIRKLPNAGIHWFISAEAVFDALLQLPSAQPDLQPTCNQLATDVMLKVPNGQDPYNVIGQYIQNHITAIEDIIATIEIDGIRTNELFMVDMQEDGDFVWEYDWYEGEQDIALIDFFPVSNAKPERDEPVGCNGCRYDWFGDPRCNRCARAFQDYYEADMRGEQNEQRHHIQTGGD